MRATLNTAKMRGFVSGYHRPPVRSLLSEHVRCAQSKVAGPVPFTAPLMGLSDACAFRPYGLIRLSAEHST